MTQGDSKLRPDRPYLNRCCQEGVHQEGVNDLHAPFSLGLEQTADQQCSWRGCRAALRNKRCQTFTRIGDLLYSFLNAV